MDRVKRSYWFWALVLVAVMLPVSSETRSKRVYKADIALDGHGVGSSVITEASTGYDYVARTHAWPNQVITKASLTNTTGDWDIVLCENGGLAGDCTYDSNGDLDISGAINGTMLGLAGVSGATFSQTLRGGNLWIRLNGGSHGTGRYVRIL